MTSRDVNDVKCRTCPDTPYPSAPDNPVGVVPTIDDTLEGLPDGTVGGPLPDVPGIKYCDTWGVHTGGFAEDHLVSILFATPEGIDRFGIHPDGSIEYEKGLDDFEPPSPIDGYERDPENHWFFKPLWESCAWRHYKVALKEACQCIDVLAMCTANRHWVRYKDCLRCKCRLPIRNRPTIKHKTIQSLRLPDLDHSSK